MWGSITHQNVVDWCNEFAQIQDAGSPICSLSGKAAPKSLSVRQTVAYMQAQLVEHHDDNVKVLGSIPRHTARWKMQPPLERTFILACSLKWVCENPARRHQLPTLIGPPSWGVRQNDTYKQFRVVPDFPSMWGNFLAGPRLRRWRL